MKLKTQDYCIEISYKYGINATYDVKTCFVIKAANVNEEKALKVAQILFPDFTDIKVVSIKNDENTLTFEDYSTLHMMVNDKLVASLKGTKTTYENVTHPLDLKYKNLLEKMAKRIGQFQQPFCC